MDMHVQRKKIQNNTYMTFEDLKNEKLKVAAYVRVSTTSKKQETSFVSQRSYYYKIINDNENW